MTLNNVLRLGEIDFTRELVKPKLYLCKPNKKSISILKDAYNIVLGLKMGALNELSFKLPVMVERKHQLVKNEDIDRLKGRYLIKIVLGDYEEYFMVNQINKQAQGEEYLDCTTLALGYELNDKLIRDYKVVSKTATEVLNDLLKDTIWSVGYVDSEFNLKYRGVEVSSSTILEVIFDVAKTFNALVVFDSINRKVSFYRPDSIGMNRGFKVKYGKYLEGLNLEDNSEEIITRLKLYGKEDITINSINPTGTNYIENFDYFIFPYSETREYSEQAHLSTDIINKWSHSSNWSDVNGKVKMTREVSVNEKIVGNEELRDFKVNATLKPLQGSGFMGIVIKQIDESNYYYLGYNSLLKNSTVDWGDNHLKLYKVVNGNSVVIGQTTDLEGWSTNINYDISVECYGDMIKIWINDRLVLTVNDSTFSQGRYGFIGKSQVFEISNIIVKNKHHVVDSESEFMSNELAHHLLEYDDLLEEKTGEFEVLLEQKKAVQVIKTSKDNELFKLETELKILLDERDILNTRIAQKSDQIDAENNLNNSTSALEAELTVLQAELNAKLVEISQKNAEIESKENEIIVVEQDLQEVENDITKLKIQLDVANNFPTELLKERNQYIVEKEWQDTNIDNVEDLLKEGKIVFEEYKQQKITLSINVVNFLTMITEQRNWDKLNIGDTFYIDYERFNIEYSAKLIEITYNFDDNNIDLTITNLKDLYGNKDKLLEMLYKSYGTSTQVSIDKWKWDLSLENKGSINDLINNIWDANKQAILGAKDQVVEISDRGLIIRDPNNPMVYLVGINGMLAITNDGGNTWKHAITSNGIVGEYIYGKIFMGVNLAIEDEHGILKFQGSKGEIFDSNGDLVMKLGLVAENPDEYGMISMTDVTQVKATNLEGFAIEQSTGVDTWEKIFWADQNTGILYSKGLVAESIKIVNDIGEEILNAETGYFDIGKFKDIVMDNKLTTIEKMQLIKELNQIYSGYQILKEQALEYQKSQRDNVVNTDTQDFTVTSSTTDLYSITPLETAYNDLINYMSQFIAVTTTSPLVIDVNNPLTEQTSEIADRAVFILKFKTYYDEADKLRNEIEDAMFYSGINMGQNYNNLMMGEFGFIALRDDKKYRAFLNATNGLALQKWENGKWVNKVYASLGNPYHSDGTLIAEDLVAKRLIIENNDGDMILDADKLSIDLTQLNTIIIDNMIMPTEKVTLANQYKSLTEQYVELLAQANHTLNSVYQDRESWYTKIDQAKDELTLDRNALTSAYEDLTTYLNPLWTNMNGKTDLVVDMTSDRVEFYAKFETFYRTYETCRNSLANFLEASSVQLGRNYNRTTIDAENGITVEGLRGEIVRMNASEGFYIEVNGERRVWINDDGTIRANKLIIENTSTGAIILDGENLSLDFTKLESIIIDNMIMPPEKVTLMNQFKGLSKQYSELMEQINHTITTIYNDRDTSYAVLDTAMNSLKTLKTTLETSFSTLSSYLNPIWVNMNKRTDLVVDMASDRTAFYAKFETFYNDYEACRNGLINFLDASSLQLGRNYNSTTIDAVNGITVEGLRGEIVRMNANEGFYIEVDGDRRVWINDDGTIRAKKLIVENDIGGVIINSETLTLDFTKLNTIIMDNVIMPPEKITLRNQYNIITEQYTELLNQINHTINNVYGNRESTYATLDDAKNTLNNSKTLLTSKYQALTTYLNPLWVNMNGKTHIVDDLLSTRTAFYAQFEDFYQTFELCRNNLLNFAEASSLQLGREYNKVTIDAVHGVTVDGLRGEVVRMNADEGFTIEVNGDRRIWINDDGTIRARRLIIEGNVGQPIINTSTLTLDFTQLNSIIIDSAIMPPEKVTLQNQYSSIKKQYQELLLQVNYTLNDYYTNRESTSTALTTAKNNLNTAKTNLTTAYNNLTTYLTPVWVNMNAKTDIVTDLSSTRTAFYAKFEDFYAQYEICRNNLLKFSEASSLQLGRDYNKTIIDAVNGITVEGNRGEIVRMNANEGFYIEVYGDKRMWIAPDGTIRARKLIIEPDGGESELILDEETDGYIADLMVNSLKSISNPNITTAVDYVYIRSNFLKLMSGTSASTDKQMFSLYSSGGNPMSIWGVANASGYNRGFINKYDNQFKFEYSDPSGNLRSVKLNGGTIDSILLDASNGAIRLTSDSKITLEVGSSKIELTTSGVKIIGNRIDLN